jgi:hypothetical protein
MVPPHDTWSEPGGSTMQVEKLTALEAHRAGRLFCRLATGWNTAPM